MTVFSSIKAAALRTTGVNIAQAFASTAQIAVEMTDLSNEVAADIAKSHDWRALTKIATITPDGSEDYPLPSDYDRMVSAGGIEDAASWFWGYEPFSSVNEWLQFKSGSYAIISPGGWIILGGQINFYPIPIGTAQYPYISNEWARSNADAPKAAFTSDDDTFMLPERLLTLGLIWRWMAQKGLEYSEALATYEVALSQEQARDRGARVYRTPSRVFGGARLAYTGTAMR
ncbi:MAG: hypothetical protein ACRCXM_09025 [Beijerinckiaceae bacterium]